MKDTINGNRLPSGTQVKKMLGTTGLDGGRNTSFHLVDCVHVEDAKDWIKTLIENMCICLFALHN
jgi:S-methylmethionine-dependent homocysteine/selenocysteine methylase